MSETVDPILALADDKFTFGNCRVIPYNRTQTALFGDSLLNSLYDACLASRPSHSYGILPLAMCGMLDLSRDAICSYWAGRNIILLTIQGNGPLPPGYLPVAARPELSDGTVVAGFSFITSFQGAATNYPGTPQPVGERSALGAYVFFRPWWGTPEIEILGMLGLAYYFHTYRLTAIHGQRYSYNSATARFMSKYGSREMATLPRFLADRKDGKPDGDVILSDCGVSTLLREDFTKYVESQLLSLVP